MNLPREEILMLSAGRELDAMVVEQFMGGYETDPAAWSVKDRWFLLHPEDGVLMGEAHPFGAPAPHGWKWEKFEPSTNIAHAWIVFEKMRPDESDEPDYWTISNMGIDWTVSSIWAHHDGDIPNFIIHAPTAPLAICRAILCWLAGPAGEVHAD